MLLLNLASKCPTFLQIIEIRSTGNNTLFTCKSHKIHNMITDVIDNLTHSKTLELDYGTQHEVFKFNTAGKLGLG